MSIVNTTSTAVVQISLSVNPSAEAATLPSIATVAPAIILAESKSIPAPLAGRGTAPLPFQGPMPSLENPISFPESKEVQNIKALLAKKGLSVGISLAHSEESLTIFSSGYRLVTILFEANGLLSEAPKLLEEKTSTPMLLEYIKPVIDFILKNGKTITNKSLCNLLNQA